MPLTTYVQSTAAVSKNYCDVWHSNYATQAAFFCPQAAVANSQDSPLSATPGLTRSNSVSFFILCVFIMVSHVARREKRSGEFSPRVAYVRMMEDSFIPMLRKSIDFRPSVDETRQIGRWPPFQLCKPIIEK